MSQHQEIMECMQCKKVPDNYISLNCEHNFCLVCMAQNFLKGGRIYEIKKTIFYICSICEQETQLDEGSVSAIELILSDLLLPILSQVSQPPAQILQTDSSGIAAKENITIIERSQHEKPENSQSKLKESQIQSQEASCKSTKFIVSLQEPFDSIYSHTPQKNHDHENRTILQANSCDKHLNEETNLYCFTCECKCICVKCLISTTQHKNHDVQNIQGSLRNLRNKMNEANHTIQASIELMNLQNKKITQQDESNQSQIDGFKRISKQSFDSIILAVQNKEKEFTNFLNSLQNIQQQQSSKLINDITIKINTLQNLKNDFERISLNKSESLQPLISIFNFYSDCKQIMQKIIGSINFSELIYLQGNETQLNIKYFPDYKDYFFGVSEFEERIQLIKESIDQLTEKCNKKIDNSHSYRSFSLYEKNWGKPTATSSTSKKCTTLGEEEQGPNLKFKSQLSLKISGKAPDANSLHQCLEKSFQKNHQKGFKNLFTPTVPQKFINKSVLDEFKSYYSDRLGSKNKEGDGQKSQKKQFKILNSQIHSLFENEGNYSSTRQSTQENQLKRSYSQLSPKEQISPYFKLPTRIQQGMFYKTKDKIK